MFAGFTVKSFAAESLVYFGTYTSTNTKGIYVSRFNPDTGKLSAPELAAETKNPTFLAVHPNGRYLYAANEISEASAISAFAIDTKSGKLTPLNQQTFAGNGACHISVDATGKCLLVANYNSGSIAALPIHADGTLGETTGAIQHTGSGVNPARQEGPHAHFILLSPDNRFALNCDLGLDKVFIYRLNPTAAKLVANDPPFASVAAGAGPRHLVFSPDGKFVYVINELASTVTAFTYDATNATMTEMQTISILPKDFSRN